MRRTLFFITLLFIFTSPGCKKENSNGKNSLTELNAETAGANCASGGYRISTGIDFNDNNILDSDEIKYEEYICNGDNGENGINSLINVVTESSGNFCVYGGLKVEAGLDQNKNGILEENEIQAINYVCNGENGQSSGEISTIRIPFSLAYSWRNAENSWSSFIQDGLLYGFNINDYEDFDSVAFIAQFHRGETADPIWLRLYDYTASEGISNSELFSTIPDSLLIDPQKRVLKSRNFATSVLSGPRTIGIQFRKQTTETRSISIHHAEIILHKSE